MTAGCLSIPHQQVHCDAQLSETQRLWLMPYCGSRYCLWTVRSVEGLAAAFARQSSNAFDPYVQRLGTTRSKYSNECAPLPVSNSTPPVSTPSTPRR